MKYINKIYTFMQGRYGIDELYKFFLYLYFFLIVINFFLKSSIVTILELIIVIIAFYRFLSKNISQRKKENRFYLKIKSIAIKPFLNIKRNYQDRDYYVYRNCRSCHTTLKLPLPEKRGIKHVKCPHCKKKMTILVLRQQKVVVIKRKEK